MLEAQCAQPVKFARRGLRYDVKKVPVPRARGRCTVNSLYCFARKFGEIVRIPVKASVIVLFLLRAGTLRTKADS